MKEIPLTHGLVALVDDSDFDAISRYKWHSLQGRYAARNEKRRPILMHRVILGVSKGEFVDHIDGNGLNNTRANLRIATLRQNMQNRKRPVTNTSGYKGVSWAAGTKKWRGFIRHDGKSVYLGSFSNAVEAARAYDEAARRLHGEFALVNFPD